MRNALDADIDPRAKADEAAIAAHRALHWRILIRHDQPRGGRLTVWGAVVASKERLVAKRKLQAAVVVGLEPGRIERALECRCVTLEQVERLRPVDDEM